MVGDDKRSFQLLGYTGRKYGTPGLHPRIGSIGIRLYPEMILLVSQQLSLDGLMLV
jgi:hypothetical protein